MLIILVLLASLLAAYTLYTLCRIGYREKGLPPGPPTIPVAGNLHQIPTKSAHFQFTQWAKQYGGLYSLKIGTGTAVVITDRQVVKQLIDKKSSIYSERPQSYVGDYMTNGNHILLMKYSPKWRGARKQLHGMVNEKMVEEHHLALQEAEARQMVRDYLLDPQSHMKHPKRFSNSVAMSILYGVRTPSPDTSHMARLYDLMEIWSKVMEPGATPPVDVYSFLHWLPQSVFSNWKDRASHVRQEMNHLYGDLLQDMRLRRKKEGAGRGSLMDAMLDQAEGQAKRQDGLSYSDHEMKFIGGTILEGGSDTSASMITAFVQAMVAYPDVQKKAQEQIDAVVGCDRSPNWSDFSQLPYVAQCVKEVMRWRPVTPLNFPHAVTEDDWIDGMLIPKGATVIINAWGLNHDEKYFSNPEAFRPERYEGITTPAPDLANGPAEKRDHYGYGSGRRICPGAHLAERNMFLAMAKLLWAFYITPGSRVPDTSAQTGYSEGFLCCVKDFDANFAVRSEARKQTILQEFAEADANVFGSFAACGGEVA